MKTISLFSCNEHLLTDNLIAEIDFNTTKSFWHSVSINLCFYCSYKQKEGAGQGSDYRRVPVCFMHS